MKKWIYACTLLLSCASSAGQAAGTPLNYPVVMVHGIFGFDDIWGVDYFYRIPQAMQQEGAQVFVASVSAANSTEVRGEQLRTYVQAVLAQTGATKVNLIGHSHGGPTVRYVASVSPEMVASVTSIGGVNWGSRFADFMRGQVPTDSASEWLIKQGLDTLARVIAGVSGSPQRPQDSLAMTQSLTTEGSIAFNQRYPEGMPSQYCGQGQSLATNGVHYFSWSGAKPFTNALDPIDYGLKLTSLVFNEPNDGLVSSCSSHVGKVIKDNYTMNHLDEVNHTFGITSWFETNPVTLYRQHMIRLRQLGL
ncbi:triacylglycerol lipase [Shewanella sp. SR44-3]|uniref:lipase family alpha/beta hydrolase n=1 Tax=unclassified Shewanella TaxID=196818 RepID=UPI0015F7D7E4|nr:triacylglycerol lipase [Shewanella sp. SR44-3]MBB1270828.1 triacylglycerol lipase [Shewanella sp. SR44-3]